MQLNSTLSDKADRAILEDSHLLLHASRHHKSQQEKTTVGSLGTPGSPRATALQ